MKHRAGMRFPKLLASSSIALALASFSSFAQQKPLSEVEIWQLIIKESIQAYSRSCPCPYSADALGQRCGNQSAHSRGTPAAPMCYPQDIPEDHLARYRERFQ
jgi:hypothetical protein